MKVTQVALCPTEASVANGRPSLTPELLAASGARYSRNNEGLEAILAKIDPENLDRSVDSIFRMIDYGHQSIADMAPVAMFIDGISIWLAYYVWTLCPMAGGQESSTRYIKLSIDGLIPPDALGIPADQHAEWYERMENCFAAYQDALNIWEDIAAKHPDVARIPRSLLSDPSDKASKQVARMKRNYGFDRARYFLPVAAATNMMLVMSARNWVQLCQYLFSHILPEARRLGDNIRAELQLATPRLLNHATEKPSFMQGLRWEFEQLQQHSIGFQPPMLRSDAVEFEHPPTPKLDVMLPDNISEDELATALKFHDNRYAWVGQQLKRTAIRFQWEAVAFAEIRDLNRHRTGTKTCVLLPVGFYGALDQLQEGGNNGDVASLRLRKLGKIGAAETAYALDLLRSGIPEYVYSTVLGTQYAFEHLTTADKYVYEAELRTGAGAHFRYAQHLHDMLTLWYAKFPQTRRLVLEGSAETE